MLPSFFCLDETNEHFVTLESVVEFWLNGNQVGFND